MARVFRKVTKRIFIVINIVLVALFLLACCNMFLHPEKWWFIALLGLSFPFLLALVTAFLIFWLIFRSRWAFLSLAALILGYTNIRALLGFSFRKEFTLEKPKGSLRVLTWNVTSFDELTRPKKKETYRRAIFDFLREQDADVLCFQEYLEPNLPKGYSNMQDLARLGYRYHVIATDYSRYNGTFLMGVALFSKYPIVDSSRIRYNGPKSLRAAESLIRADVLVDGKTIRFFTTHLQSVLLQKKDYRSLEIIKNADDSMVQASRSIVRKLKQAYTFRGDQVDIVRHQLDESPYPVVICGDFNDIPNSYTYFRVKGSRNDAFVKAGTGIGRTFSNVSPTLRIDYIMAGKQFDVLQYKRYLLPYSEHYPVVSDIILKDSAR